VRISFSLCCRKTLLEKSVRSLRSSVIRGSISSGWRKGRSEAMTFYMGRRLTVKSSNSLPR